MNKEEINNKINELTLAMAKDPSNTENYHRYLNCTCRLKITIKLCQCWIVCWQLSLMMFKLLSEWELCGFMKKISESLCLTTIGL